MIKERLNKPMVYGSLLALGAVATLMSGCSSGHTSGTCLSPAAVSKPYLGDKTPGVVDTNQSTWRLGIEVSTPRPPRDNSYIGLVVGFKNPDDRSAVWHDSETVSPQDDIDKKIQLRIGAGDVIFRAQVKAAAGSIDCRKAPDTTFSNPQPLKNFTGTHPNWTINFGDTFKFIGALISP